MSNNVPVETYAQFQNDLLTRMSNYEIRKEFNLGIGIGAGLAVVTGIIMLFMEKSKLPSVT